MKNKYFYFFVVTLFLILAIVVVVNKIHTHNIDQCYQNITQVSIGDDYNKALLKMNEGLIFGSYKTEENVLFENSNSNVKIIFPYNNRSKDPLSSTPYFIDNTTSNKVIAMNDGLFY
jgi:CRISPR/Cas system CMR-associated protein Cmr1 (group 7 of RAMP superfamily)